MPEDLKATILQLEERRYRAMCEADAATLEKLLADTLVYTHSTGAADGKAAYIAGVRDTRARFATSFSEKRVPGIRRKSKMSALSCS